MFTTTRPVTIALPLPADPSPRAPQERAVPLVVIGGGEAAAAACRVIRAQDPAESRWRLTGLLDDSGAATPSPGDAACGVIGGVRLLVDLEPGTCFVLAAGTPATRRIVASWAAARGRAAVGVADPSSAFHPAVVGAGHVIGARARISSAAVVGEFAAVGADAMVDDGARVGDFVTVGAGTCVEAGAVVEDEVILGRNVRVTPGVHVGARAVVHDGVVVTDDVPADARVAVAVLPSA